MNMNIKDWIGCLLVSAIQNLFASQPDVLIRTPMTGMTEWNFGHHLANEMSKYIFWLNHDLDVTKRGYDNRRPDIIFHKRGINSLNFLVAEIKIRGPVDNDIKRIKKHWMAPTLHYRFGASVLVEPTEEFKVTVLHNESSQVFKKSNALVSVPKISESEREAFAELVNSILTIVKKGDFQADKTTQAEVEKLEKQIDHRIYKVYGLREE